MTGQPATTVWCASYPKSGNTWVRALMTGILGDGSVRIANLTGESGNDQAAIFREFGLTPSVLDDRLSFALMRDVSTSVALRSQHPVFIKTHNSFASEGARGASHTLRVPTRAIYVARDPRSVAVSLAHHLGCSQTEAVDVMETGPKLPPHSDRFPLRHCKVAFEWGSWSENVTSWLDQRDVPVTVVRYEDLSKDTYGVLSDVLADVGIEASEELVRDSVQASTFDQLVVQELFEGFSEASSADRHFFRRGEAESWEEELEAGLADRITSTHRDVMRRLGYLA